IFACASGSALKDEGIVEFLGQLDFLTETDYDHEGPFAGRVYKIRHDENGARITFIKVVSGTLHIRDEVSYGKWENRKNEKATQLRVYNGEKCQTADAVRAGELAAIVGLSAATIGDGLGELTEEMAFDMVPILKSKVLFDASIHAKDMLACLRRLEAEDPSLQIIWDEHFQEIHIHMMG